MDMEYCPNNNLLLSFEYLYPLPRHTHWGDRMSIRCQQSAFVRFFWSKVMVWAVIFTILMPVPPLLQLADANNSFIQRRLSSPERAKVIEEARIKDQAQQQVQVPQSANSSTSPATTPVADRQTPARSESTRPKSLGELMFNNATGLFGMPGLL